MVKKSAAGLSNDDFFDSFCYLLELRGKMDVARRLRAAYYGLEADTDDSEESGSLLRDESDVREAAEHVRSESPFPDEWDSLGDYSSPSTRMAEAAFDDLYYGPNHKRK